MSLCPSLLSLSHSCRPATLGLGVDGAETCCPGPQVQVQPSDLGPVTQQLLPNGVYLLPPKMDPLPLFLDLWLGCPVSPETDDTWPTLILSPPPLACLLDLAAPLFRMLPTPLNLSLARTGAQVPAPQATSVTFSAASVTLTFSTVPLSCPVLDPEP